MKILIFLSLLFLTASFFFGCTKKETGTVPILSTTPVTNITATTATSGGFITSDGGAKITARGVCWSLTNNPATSDSKTTDSVGTGQFVSNITELKAGTIYHVRAYATNSIGTDYGADLSFSTLGQIPDGTTQPATNVSAIGATLNGLVNANYLSTTVTFEYGTTTSYGSTITATQSPVLANTNTKVSADISSLTAGTTYHFILIAVNSFGTVYGDDISFTTIGQAPTAETQSASGITTIGAILNGIVNANYLPTTVTFEYGTTTSYGSTAAYNLNPLTGNIATSVSVNISGLMVGTTYHFRVKAVNSHGTTYGSDMSFVTLGQVPTATTLPATNINSASATLNGTVNANYVSTVVTFEFGTTTSYGSTATANQSPVTGSTLTNVSADITGLTAGTTYHFRVKAINSLGTAYGMDATFATSP